MTNGIFTLNWSSIADTAIMAVVAAIGVGLVQVVTTSGFDLFTADWVMIGKNMANLGFIAGVVTLGHDFLSTNSGSLLGITPDTPPAK